MSFTKLRYATKRVSPLLLSALIAVTTVIGTAPAVFADSYDSKINQLRQNNNQSAAKQQQLKSEANNLAERVANLQAEATALQAQVQATQNKLDQIHGDIERAQSELNEKRIQLAAVVHQMYVDDGMSMLEMLASNHDMSHFIDEAQYQQSVQNKVKSTVDRVKALERKLSSDKKSVEQLLVDQQAMKARADAQAAEANRLVQLNAQQQAQYNQSIAGNNAQMSRLRAQQAAENARGFTPTSVTKTSSGSSNGRAAASSGSSVKPVSGTSYPWANAPFPNEMPDPWGMYKRQCVSYTAWKVASSGRHMPFWGGRGNAKQWDDNARAAGIPVDNSPRVGDVAVSNAGAYGHVMYVEAVHGDGTITISQYNAGWDGRYSEGRRSSAGLAFIHF